MGPPPPRTTSQTSVQREDDGGGRPPPPMPRSPFTLSLLLRPPLGACAAYLQRLPKVCAPGSVNIVTAVAYHFCLNLHAAFTQPGASTLADLCTSHGGAAPVFRAQKIAWDMYHGELHFVYRVFVGNVCNSFAAWSLICRFALATLDTLLI